MKNEKDRIKIIIVMLIFVFVICPGLYLIYDHNTGDYKKIFGIMVILLAGISNVIVLFMLGEKNEIIIHN